jgi:hypothetical protein
MLRRYLIINGTTTALLYGAIYALAPSMKMLDSLRAGFDGFVMQSPMLGPIINRVIVVTSAF